MVSPVRLHSHSAAPCQIPLARPPMIEQALGRYNVLEKIGEGGMGVVYLAPDSELNRDVALKVLRDEVSHDDMRMERFRREAQVLASLNHPNIASIYGIE